MAFEHMRMELIERTEHNIDRRKIIVFVITVVVIFSAIIFMCVFFTSKDKTTSSHWKDENEEICIDKECIETAGFILRFMNQSANPCNSFYNYACGRFNQMNAHGSSGLLTFRQLLLRNSFGLIGMLIREYQGEELSFVAMQTYYRSCKLADDYGVSFEQDMLDIIQSLGGSQLFGNWETNSWNLTKVIAKAMNDYAVQPLFQLHRMGNNSFRLATQSLDSNMLFIQQPIEKRKVKLLMENIVSSLLHNGSVCNKLCIQDFVNDAMRMEEDLFQISLKFIKTNKVDTYNRSRYNENYRDFDVFHFIELFEPIASDTTITASQGLIEVFQNLTRTSDRKQLHNFVTWTVIANYMYSIGKHYFDMDKTDSVSSNPLITDKTYSDFCFESVMRYFPFELNTLMIEHMGKQQYVDNRIFFDIARSTFLDSFNWNANDSFTSEKESLRLEKLHFMRNVSKDVAMVVAPEEMDVHNFLKSSVTLSVKLLELAMGTPSANIVPQSGCLAVTRFGLKCPFFIWSPNYLDSHSSFPILAGSLGVDLLELFASRRGVLFTDIAEQYNNTIDSFCLASKLNADLSQTGADPIFRITPEHLAVLDIAFKFFNQFRTQNNTKRIVGFGSVSPEQLFYLAYAQSECASIRLVKHQRAWEKAVNTVLYNLDHFRNVFGCSMWNGFSYRHYDCHKDAKNNI